MLEYTGDSLVTSSGTSSSSTGTVDFAAAVREEADGSFGDRLATAQVRFSAFKYSDILLLTPVAVCTGSIASGTAGAGIAKCPVSLPADNYTLKLELLTNNYYAAPVESEAVTVVQPGTGISTGGGWIDEPSLGNRSNFGFTVRFLKNGNVQGNSLYIYRVRRDIGYGLRDYNWIIKSNAMGALAQKCSTAAPSVCNATFTGKNTITVVDRETGMAYSQGGNYQFQVDVTDKGEPASGGAVPADSYALRIWDATGTYYVLGGYGPNNTSTTNTTQVPIAGGNIQVRPQK